MPDEPGRSSLDRQAGRRELTRLADDVLPALIARFGAGGLAELEVRHGDWRARLRRATGGPEGLSVDGAAASGGPRSRDGRDGRDGREGRGDGTRRTEPDADGGGRSVVASPAVGYFQPADGLEIGHPLRTGDVLGHVDVLGIRHDVVVPVDGVLAKVQVESGEAVEYGQELARVDHLTDRPEPV